MGGWSFMAPMIGEALGHRPIYADVHQLQVLQLDSLLFIALNSGSSRSRIYLIVVSVFKYFFLKTNMSTEVKVPALGESITSGILVTWLVKEGDYVNKGDLLYELETDKITEAPARVAGTISLAKEGDEVDIGQAVASIDESTTPPDSSDSSVEASPKVEENTSASSSKGTSEELMPYHQPYENLWTNTDLIRLQIKGTGKGGRPIKADVLSAIDSNSAPPSSEPVKEPDLESNIIQDGRTTDKAPSGVKLLSVLSMLSNRLHFLPLLMKWIFQKLYFAQKAPRGIRSSPRHKTRLHVILRQGSRSWTAGSS